MTRTMLKRLYASVADQRLLTKGLWIVLIPVGPLVLTAVLLYVGQRFQHDAEEAVARSIAVERELYGVLALLSDAESRQRGYLLTGSEDWLNGQTAGHEARAIFERLKTLIIDQEQRDRVGRLSTLTNERLAALNDVANEARELGCFPATVSSSRLDHGRELMATVRGETEAMFRRQAALLAARSTRVQEVEQTLRLIAAGGAAVGVLGGVTALLLFTSGISSRVRVLTTGADCLARGAPLPPTVQGQDEIGLLGQHLHRAADLLVARERELHRAHEAVDRFFTLSLDLFCVAGFDGSFKRLNPAWPETLGWTVDELLAQPFLDFVHPEDRPATMREAEKLAQGAVTISFENRYRCRDGTYRWVQWMAVPVVDGALIYAVARDVTTAKAVEAESLRLTAELEQRNAQLTALNHELEAFSYSVSHDLRAPLRAIDGFSQILLEDYADKVDSEGRDALQRVRTAAIGMGELIDALLALSRLSRVELRSERIDVSALAWTITNGLRELQPSRHAEFVIATDVAVDGDRTLLKAALENLLGNAWKYSNGRAETRIEFGTLDSGHETVYFVRDNGVGFDMAYVGKLFGAFQRLHRQSEFGGTGIGLATVQRIIHRHGGRVWAEGAVDHGATFYFTLPCSIAGVRPVSKAADTLASVS